MKMNSCLRSLFVYFEAVLHPASGWSDNQVDKKKRKPLKISDTSFQPSPECFNTRGILKKQDKLRRNPAP